MSPSRRLFLSALMIVSTLSLPTRAGEHGGSSNAAIDILFGTAEKLDMLALGESHWSLPEHHFLKELLLDPRFPKVFPTIIVEFGNALYQGTIDRYLTGENVSSRDLNMVWQDTTMPRAWDSPLYAEFFDTVREVNKRLPQIKKLRVFLGDPPIDWSKVKNAAEFKKFMDRDAFYAEVMARNCGRERCLLICGSEHFHWKDPLANLRPPSAHKNALEYYRTTVGNAKRIESVLPIYSQSKIFTQNSVPSLLSTHAPPLGTMRFGQVDQSPVMILKQVDGETKPVEVRADDTLPISDVVDWVLYLGKADQQSEPPPSLYQDRTYVRELYRRSKIVGEAFGFDLSADIKEIDPDAKR
jgi:hypothetical protein